MNAVNSRRVVQFLILALLAASCSPSPAVTPTGAAPVATTVAAPTVPAPTVVPTTVPTAVPTAVPTTAPTAVPTVAPTPVPTATVPVSGGHVPLFAFQAPDNRILLADAGGAVSALVAAEFPFESSPVFPSGRATSSTLYLLATAGPGGRQGAYAVSGQGVRALDFISRTGYMLTVWPGDAKQKPRLAWNVTEGTSAGMYSAIYSANTDGSELRMLLEQESQDGHVLLPLRWSRDGKRLFYSNEQTGFGGYILFAGVSSLSVFDLAKGTGTTLIAEFRLGLNRYLCITDISPDEKQVAHTCDDEHAVSMLPLGGGEATTIDSPPDVALESGQRGSAMFGPDGVRLAYAAARGEYEGEQGWALVDESMLGVGRLIATSAPNDYYNVKGWLDDNTIVLQSYGEKPAVWLVYLDGTELKKVGEGLFLAIVP